MDTEDQILKGTKFITNTINQRLKIWDRGQTLKNTILKKTKQNRKSYKKVYEICFKSRVFYFARYQQVLKMKIKGVIKNLKIKKRIKK